LLFEIAQRSWVMSFVERSPSHFPFHWWTLLYLTCHSSAADHLFDSLCCLFRGKEKREENQFDRLMSLIR
jgi:hypothetical protein